MVYVLFALFIYVFTGSPISTEVLNNSTLKEAQNGFLTFVVPIL